MKQTYWYIAYDWSEYGQPLISFQHLANWCEYEIYINIIQSLAQPSVTNKKRKMKQTYWYTDNDWSEYGQPLISFQHLANWCK